MTRFLPTVAIIGAAALSASLFAAPAMADTLVSEPVTLSYDAAQLASHGNAGAVFRELKRQARKACVNVRPLLHVQTIDKTCAADILAQAVAAINHPALNQEFKLIEGYDVVEGKILVNVQG